MNEPASQYNEQGEALPDYRELSRASVAAAVVGLASPLVLVHLAFALLPLAATLLAIAALLGGRGDTRVGGLGAARAALAWSLFWLVTVTTAQILDFRQDRLRAHTYMTRWLDLLRARDFETARILALAPEARPTRDPVDGSTSRPARTPVVEQSLTDFLRSPIPQKIAEIDRPGALKARPFPARISFRDGDQYTFSIHYLGTPGKSPSDEFFGTAVLVRLAPTPDQISRWLVSDTKVFENRSQLPNP